MLIRAIAVTALLAAPPPPAAHVPSGPVALARSLTAADASVRREIARWDRRSTPNEVLTLEALYVQRALRMLSRHPELAARLRRRLSPRLAGEVRDVVVALRDLRRLAAGWPPHRIVVGSAAPLATLSSHYGAAQRRFGVGVHVLGAVNFVESAFGRLRNESVSGARGPMQFMPATWRAYGLGGDVRDPHDAIMGAANYLHANGAPGSYARALFHYNPSPLYVEAVMRYARFVARDRAGLPLLYTFQVYAGGRRLTGPGV
jgi:membrane-bound lytic murein transglycosylase B